MKYWPQIEEYVEKEKNPKLIIEEAAFELEELSKGKAYAKVEEYVQRSNYSPIATVISALAITNSDKQLAETGDVKIYSDKVNLEFLICSKIEIKYHYRVFTVEIRQNNYPLTMRLDSDISEEIYQTLKYFDNTAITIQNAEDLESTLVQIFQSNKIKFIIGKLMALKEEKPIEIEKTEINTANEN